MDNSSFRRRYKYNKDDYIMPDGTDILIKMIKLGMTAGEIQTAIRVSSGTIRNRCKELGIKGTIQNKYYENRNKQAIIEFLEKCAIAKEKNEDTSRTKMLIERMKTENIVPNPSGEKGYVGSKRTMRNINHKSSEISQDYGR